MLHHVSQLSDTIVLTFSLFVANFAPSPEGKGILIHFSGYVRYFWFKRITISYAGKEGKGSNFPCSCYPKGL